MMHARTPSSERSFSANYFVDDAPLRKTMTGQREFEQRCLPLRAEQRRLLILIDGKRTAQSLAGYFRRDELPHLLEELCALGLVDSLTTEASFAASNVHNEPSVSIGVPESRFEAVKQAAIEATQALLGSLARPYCVALTLCRERTRLRDLFNQIDDKLSATLGRDASTVFCETLRQAALSPSEV
jgi:hypothetical protein